MPVATSYVVINKFDDTGNNTAVDIQYAYANTKCDITKTY